MPGVTAAGALGPGRAPALARPRSVGRAAAGAAGRHARERQREGLEARRAGRRQGAGCAPVAQPSVRARGPHAGGQRGRGAWGWRRPGPCLLRPWTAQDGTRRAQADRQGRWRGPTCRQQEKSKAGRFWTGRGRRAPHVLARRAARAACEMGVAARPGGRSKGCQTEQSGPGVDQGLTGEGRAGKAPAFCCLGTGAGVQTEGGGRGRRPLGGWQRSSMQRNPDGRWSRAGAGLYVLSVGPQTAWARAHCTRDWVVMGIQKGEQSRRGEFIEQQSSRERRAAAGGGHGRQAVTPNRLSALLHRCSSRHSSPLTRILWKGG
jgi:hypothetical protein